MVDPGSFLQPITIFIPADDRCTLILLQPIAFACRDKGSDPPQQLGHHPIESPVEKCSTRRIRSVRYVGNHARDQRDANLLADGDHFQLYEHLAQLLRRPIHCGEAAIVDDSGWLMDPLEVEVVNGVFEHCRIAMIVLGSHKKKAIGPLNLRCPMLSFGNEMSMNRQGEGIEERERDSAQINQLIGCIGAQSQTIHEPVCHNFTSAALPRTPKDHQNMGIGTHFFSSCWYSEWAYDVPGIVDHDTYSLAVSNDPLSIWNNSQKREHLEQTVFYTRILLVSRHTSRAGSSLPASAPPSVTT